MSNYTFIYRDNEGTCAYVELSRIGMFELGHYFVGVELSGASWSGTEWPSFENIETVLTEDEYKRLIAYDEAIHSLKYGIEEGDERYKQGIALTAEIQDILDKLRGDENNELFTRIQEEEIQEVTDEYDLSEDEVREIFDYSPYGYKDGGLLCYIFKDKEDVGRDHAESCGNIPIHLENYIDYEAYGKDICSSEEYYALSDGRIVRIYM